MGINDIEEIRNDDFAMQHIFNKDDSLLCSFCRKELIGVFCSWYCNGVHRFHTECATKYGINLIREAGRAESESKRKDCVHNKVRQRTYLNSHNGIRLTGSGGGDELEDRLDRISIVISYAAGMAAVKRHVDDRVFLASILAVDDCKGSLSVLWQNQAAAISFGPLVVDAWVFVNELEESVEHYVMKDEGPQPLYYGRDPRNHHDPHYRSMECTFT